MPDSPVLPSSLRLDAQGRIAQDITCISCDYNLKTLSPDTNCPECGQPAAASLNPTRLCFANPKWLKQLRRGLNWVLASVAIFIALRLVGTMLSVSLDMAMQTASGYQLFIVSFIGHWLFISTPSGEIVNTISHKRRRWSRVALVIGTLGILTSTTFGNFGPLGVIPVILIGVASLIVIAAAVLTYARKLALHIPDQGLAGAVRAIMWLWIVYITLACTLVCAKAMELKVLSSIQPATLLVLLFNFMIGLAIIAMILLLFYRRRLGKVLKLMTQE